MRPSRPWQELGGIAPVGTGRPCSLPLGSSNGRKALPETVRTLALTLQILRFGILVMLLQECRRGLHIQKPKAFFGPPAGHQFALTKFPVGLICPGRFCVLCRKLPMYVDWVFLNSQPPPHMHMYLLLSGCPWKGVGFPMGDSLLGPGAPSNPAGGWVGGALELLDIFLALKFATLYRV